MIKFHFSTATEQGPSLPLYWFVLSEWLQLRLLQIRKNDSTIPLQEVRLKLEDAAMDMQFIGYVR